MAMFHIHIFILGIAVVRPQMSETTSLGAALAAASTVGLWSIKDHEANATVSDHHPKGIIF